MSQSLVLPATQKPTRWTHSNTLNETEYSELLRLLEAAEVKPYTRNSGGGWGWRKPLTTRECDLIYRSWGDLLLIYENHLETK